MSTGRRAADRSLIAAEQLHATGYPQRTHMAYGYGWLRIKRAGQRLTL
jgi:hypothetical protein